MSISWHKSALANLVGRFLMTLCLQTSMCECYLFGHHYSNDAGLVSQDSKFSNVERTSLDHRKEWNISSVSCISTNHSGNQRSIH
jgi:hypothetical protein